MDPIRVDPMTGLQAFAKALAGGSPYSSKWITTKIGMITVDTSLPTDTNIWETGIHRKLIEGKWILVEQYPNELAARTGHEAWVKILTEFPDYPLKDIDNWSLNQKWRLRNETWL